MRFSLTKKSLFEDLKLYPKSDPDAKKKTPENPQYFVEPKPTGRNELGIERVDLTAHNPS
jgi:hypothetical protein